MENKITNLKKTEHPLRWTVWRFEYDGMRTEAVEAEFDNETKLQALDIIMHCPQGRYFQKVHVNAEILTLYETDALNMAAEMCLKAYEKRAKQQND